MSEQPTPGVSQATAERCPETLTPEKIDSILSDFRSWLLEAAAKGGTVEAAPPRDRIDLHTLLAQFTALRHEVKLQTKAVRAQQEQNAGTLAALQQAVETLRQPAGGPTGEGQEPDRAHLKTLIEIHDALALALREAQRLREVILPSLEPFSAARGPVDLPAAPFRSSFLARLLGMSESSAVVSLRQALAQEQAWRDGICQTVNRARGLLDSLVTGYTMSVQRLERALRQNELEPIPCVGLSFDPERMEALEVVTDTDRPSGEVIDEIRRGYLWRGRVLRPAQVRVAKSSG
jgi:molecular chaperone GrpE